MGVDEFKSKCEAVLRRLEPKDKPKSKFDIGDQVITKDEIQKGYITQVIGVGRPGRVVTKDYIPLVDFGKNRTYYVHQDKLTANG